MRNYQSLAVAFVAVLHGVTIGLAAESDKKADSQAVREMPKDILYNLEDYCFKCHDDDFQKGDIRLDNLSELETEKRLDLLNRMQEQVYFKHMPPEKEDDQPSEEERKALLNYISAELAVHKASTLEGKLQKPEYGNYIDHEKLFSGEYRDVPSFTNDRRWLISEFIFNAKFQRILEHKPTANYDGNRVQVLGSNKIKGVSLTNPFLLPEVSGVRYYANEDLTGGHLSSMLTNAQNASEYMTSYLVPRHKGRYLPAITDIMAMEDQHNATLASRHEFLNDFIELVCDDIYGDENVAMLPKFTPVKINEIKELEEGEKYKKAPIHVAQNMLSGLDADKTVYRLLQDPDFQNLSDDEFREVCERKWFYRGHHELKIQGRMTLLRDYLQDFRDNVEKIKRKIKPLEYAPLDESEMATIRASIKKHRSKGDYYEDIIEKCMADWEQGFVQDRIDAGPPSDELLLNLINQLSELILERPPTSSETEEYLALSKSYVDKLGNLKAVQKLIQTFILSSEFVYRQEFGTGEPDQHGRRMMSPRDASYAISYALTDESPDEELAKAAAEGRLNTREDYEREVKRLLAKRDQYFMIDPVLADKNWQDNTTNLPVRELRFFREFFGYPGALKIFKDEKRFGGDRLDQATNRVVNEADRWIEYILKNDRNVFEEILTTDEFYVFHDGNNERMKELSDQMKRVYAYWKDKDWENFDYKELAKHTDFLREEPLRHVNPDNLKSGNRSGDGLKLFKKCLRSITARLDKGQRDAAPFDRYRGYGSDFMPGENVAKLWGYRKDNWDWSATQPASVPNRKGILTHPAWLLAFALNTETDPVHRGKFVREKLLAGTIPDVPITVDAQIPEDHNQTLRTRLASASEEEYCWKCHVKMNPLGYTFEMYDDFGRYREEESLEYPEHMIEKKPDKAKDRNHLLDLRDIYKTLPVDPTGYLEGTGNEKLDGELKNALELSERLGKSRRVRQSIIRHAFRYFMGRNEELSDSKTLMDAEDAYVDSGGSFDAVIVSLLTSDSFIYRKSLEN